MRYYNVYWDDDSGVTHIIRSVPEPAAKQLLDALDPSPKVARAWIQEINAPR